MIAAVWMLAALSLLLWSLLLWGVQALLALDAVQVVAHWKEVIGAWPVAGWLDAWWPGWLDLLGAAVEAAQGLLNGVSEWLQAAMWLMWGLWCTGTVLILLAAALTHAFVKACSAPRLPAAGTGTGSR